MRPVVFLFAAIAIASTSACSGEKTASAAAPVSRPASEIQAPAPAYFETTGPIVVENQVDILAQRQGVVAEILVMNDAPVRNGQLLARLDNRQLTADRDAAEAKTKAIAADLKNFETAQKLAEIDLSRDEELFQNNLITQKQVDHSRTRVVGVKFEVERERENLANAQAALRSLELELEKTRISAPFAGVVGRRYIRVGQTVAENDKLFWISGTDPLRVQFTVPESYAGKLHSGDRLNVHLSSAPDVNSDASITTVSPVVDPASGTIDVQAQLGPHPKEMLPGMTAVIRLPK